MRKRLASQLSILTVSFGLTFGADAALIDRAGGLIYDTVLDITWLQDAAYGQPPSPLSFNWVWQDGVDWASTFTYFDSARNQTLTGWRLPKALPVDGVAFDSKFSYDGSTDNGYNITSPNSELAYMYYINLGNIGAYDRSGNAFPAGFSQYPNVTFADADTGLPTSFLNLQKFTYRFWSGTATAYPPGGTGAWMFDTRFGNQFIFPQYGDGRIWLVRDGDVGMVPEPRAYSLLLIGLALIYLPIHGRRPWDRRKVSVP